MRDVVLDGLLSLDGVAEEPSWFMDAGPEAFDNVGRVAPVVASRGRRPFDGDEELQRLELVAVDRSLGGTPFLAHRA